MKHPRLLYYLVSAFAFAALAAAPAPADIGINVSPAKLELSMSPGTATNIPVTVANGTTDATHVQATMVDFGVGESGDYQIERVGTRTNSLLKYASISPREFDLAPQTIQQVKLSLALPAHGLEGEYAGIVFFQTRPPRVRNGAVSFSVRVASKFYLTIPGTVKIDGEISKMSQSKGAGHDTYRVLFKNTGNAHVYLRGEIAVSKDGAQVDRIQMPSEVLVERGGERLIEVTGKALSPGKYQAVATIDYGGKQMTGGEIVFVRS